MKLIILDRDGVINYDSPDFIKSPDEWIPIPGSLEAIARLSEAGWKVVLASNQSGIARRLFSMNTLVKIHTKMRKELAEVGGIIDAMFVCPHGPEDDCLCRKPRPGLFHDIARRYEVSLEGVPAVGDSLRDLQAAHFAGCSPWLVRTGNGVRTLEMGNLPSGTQVCDNLASVVDTLLAKE